MIPRYLCPPFSVHTNLPKFNYPLENRGRSHKLRNSPQAQGLRGNGVKLRYIRWPPYWDYARRGIGSSLAWASFNYPTTLASANAKLVTYINHSHHPFERRCHHYVSVPESLLPSLSHNAVRTTQLAAAAEVVRRYACRVLTRPDRSGLPSSTRIVRVTRSNPLRSYW